MPVTTTPDTLKAYVFHGLDLQHKTGDEATCECPFCGRAGKFHVNIHNGMWRCVVCNTGSSKGGGNVYTFIRKLHEVAQCPEASARELARDRKLLRWETLRDWGCVLSPITSEWLVPGYSPDSRLLQLYRYTEVEGKYRLLATSTLPHQLFGMTVFDPAKPDAYVCEGPWDGMALWETLGCTKVLDGRYTQTSNPDVSLLATANVVAVPGVGVFPDSWAALFGGKRVFLTYDNDHPRRNPQTGRDEEPAAWHGMKRVAGVLSRAGILPQEVRYAAWGEGNHNQHLPDGWDVRDFLSAADKTGGRPQGLGSLLALYKPIPEDWVSSDGKGSVDIKPLPCDSWNTVLSAYRKAMKMTEGHDRTLSIMFACVASTTMPDDQLWVQVISPPSSGKTSLCDGLSTARKYCRQVENFTGLHSGFQTDFDGEEDNSLLVQLKDMTLIIKEADPLLRAPNRDKILGQLRAAYDTNTAVAYGNKIKREYKNHRFTVIMCGTEALYELDSSELGARFLTVVIMNSIDADLESEINGRVFYRVFRNRGTEANCIPESHNDAAMLQAKRLAGGYVEYLRKNAAKLRDQLDDSNADLLEPYVDNLAQFVAFMQARSPKSQDEVTTRAMSSRLTAQLSKLMINLAVVLNKKVIDTEVLRRVTRTALDTARGRTYDLCKHLYERGECEERQLCAYTGETPAKMRDLLQFLFRIGAVESVTEGKSVLARLKWNLTPRLRNLWREVHVAPAG